ncbi:hypothetical protein SAMN04489712_11239 [Thermomonospora echinospora]|uniref:Excreted virulence factor EspC, type VII ESX diderm n=1 Tax=Thermomonospora echinospora TaxID=1992 RepID=A0A1H6D018_9ACTN|nr:hypothetical protein [Thermomonospora echinospora]SEG78165.1 hypothetical protein SAMN04489712_11239 [Thermomonospora echinospora]
MGKQFEVDSGQIRRGGSRMQSSAAGMRGRLQDFQARMAGYGEPWGGDDIGFAIGTIYAAASELAFECYTSQIDGIDEFSEGAIVMANNYQKSEDLSGIEVNRVRDILG